METGEGLHESLSKNQPAEGIKNENQVDKVNYNLELRNPLAVYVYRQLKPEFEKQKYEIQQNDGSYEAQMNFINNSQFGILMNKLGGKSIVKGSHDERNLELSESDLVFIKDNVTSPDPVKDHAGALVHKEFMSELEDKFYSAKTKAQGRDKITDIRNWLRKVAGKN